MRCGSRGPRLRLVGRWEPAVWKRPNCHISIPSYHKGIQIGTIPEANGEE